MRKTLPAAVAFLCVSVVSAVALAGPPLICRSYEFGDGPRPASLQKIEAFTEHDLGFVNAAANVLQTEPETLVGMAVIREVIAHGGDDPAAAEQFLTLLRQRANASRAASVSDPSNPERSHQAARSTFYAAFATETMRYGGYSKCDGDLDGLRKAVQELGTDGAAWLGLSRAVTPLMRTGTLQEHATAFVRAHDLGSVLPAGPVREHLLKTVAHDLDTVIGHLVDSNLRKQGISPSPATRLAALRKAVKPGFVVHEWGTFTSLQGSNGVSLEGLHHEEEDLPAFVYSRTQVRDCPLRSRGYKGLEVPVEHVTQKMETPVLYFHTQTPRRVRVRVDFVRGLLTQWYPVSDLLGPPEKDREDGPLDVSRVDRSFLEWEVDLIPRSKPAPAEIRTVGKSDLWGIARDVDAAYVRTVPRVPPRSGPTEAENYIFYRGLGNFTLPLNVQVAAGGMGLIHNRGPEPLPAVFAVEVRPEGARFRALGSVPAGAHFRFGPATEPLRPTTDVARELQSAVAAALIGQGLFGDEAEAMVRTWDRQWFSSEGTRLLYLVPRPAVDRLLPLTITPVPDAVVRILLGRLEYITPETESEVAGALRDRTSGDAAVQAAARGRLDRLGRFLEPHVRRVLSVTADAAVVRGAKEMLAEIAAAGEAR